MNKSTNILAAAFLALAVNAASGRGEPNSGYKQVNLVSDLPSITPHQDERLVNPWGIVAGEETIWVNDNGPGLVTAYNPSGRAAGFAIHVPSPAGGATTGTPSGLVLNETEAFVISNGLKHAPSTFIMATEDGTIAAWNQKLNGSNAVIMADNSGTGAVYKGLAIANGTNGEPQIYAANFHAGQVDVFDKAFNYVKSFTDTNVPAMFAPFNIRHLRGYLFVTFAKQKLPDLHDDQAGPGNGYVDIFGVDGTLLRRLASAGALNSPWGIVIAPQNFGPLSNALLVGNFGDGTINAFNLVSGEPLGPVTQRNGAAISINGLWGLAFEREDPGTDCGFEAERLYFTAGLNGEADGLFGYLRVAPPGR